MSYNPVKQGGGMQDITEQSCPLCLRKSHLHRVVLSKNRDGASFDGVFLAMSPKQFDIFEIIYERHPRGATGDYIINKLYDLREPAWPLVSIRVHICTINKNLRLMKSDWHLIGQKGVGYLIKLKERRR